MSRRESPNRSSNQSQSLRSEKSEKPTLIQPIASVAKNSNKTTTESSSLGDFLELSITKFKDELSPEQSKRFSELLFLATQNSSNKAFTLGMKQGWENGYNEGFKRSLAVYQEQRLNRVEIELEKLKNRLNTLEVTKALEASSREKSELNNNTSPQPFFFSPTSPIMSSPSSWPSYYYPSTVFPFAGMGEMPPNSQQLVCAATPTPAQPTESPTTSSASASPKTYNKRVRFFRDAGNDERSNDDTAGKTKRTNHGPK